MAIALAIISGLGLLSLGLNFLLSKYLFRILSSIYGSAANIKNKTAYDGKYYPCNLLVQILCNQDEEAIITDFSRYESDGIIGMFVKTKDDAFAEFGEDAEEMNTPVLVKNAIVYQPVEGLWTWKLQE